MKTLFALVLAVLAGGASAHDPTPSHRHPESVLASSSSVTQCPKCGAVSTYPVTMQNGGQVIVCKKCHKSFTAEVKHGEFTGRNR